MHHVVQTLIRSVAGRASEGEKIPYGAYKRIKPVLQRVKKWSEGIEDLDTTKPQTWVNAAVRTVKGASNLHDTGEGDIRNILSKWGWRPLCNPNDHLLEHCIAFMGSGTSDVVSASERVFSSSDMMLKWVEFPEADLRVFVLTRMSGNGWTYHGDKTYFYHKDIGYDDACQGILDLYWGQVIGPDGMGHLTTSFHMGGADESETRLHFSHSHYDVTDKGRFVGRASEYVGRWRAISERKSSAHVVLLHGPPGTGKTTLAWDAARKIGDRVLAVSMDALVECSFTVMSAINRLRPDTVVINDIDRCGEENMRFLVQGLDAALEDVDLILMTSNHLGKFPEAVRRPGRIDQIVEITAEDTNHRKLAERAVEKHDLDLTSQQIDDLVDIAQNHTGAYVEELALRLDALGPDAKPLLESDRTFDKNWISRETESDD